MSEIKCVPDKVNPHRNIQFIATSKMTTSTIRGRDNWACPAALGGNGEPLLVDVPVCEDEVDVLGTSVSKVQDMSTYCKTRAIYTSLLVIVVCVGLTVGVGGGGGGGSGIEVGSPTVPEQTFPRRQQPKMPLLASAQ